MAVQELSPTGPRLTRKGAATRARIVTAAAGLMFEQGAAGTSTEDVRAAAGVSSSQLYHYFHDKRALVRAVIEFQTEQVLSFQEPLLGRLDDIEALRAWRDAIVALQRQRQCVGGCPIGSLGSELSELDGDARTDLAESFRRWESAIRVGLESMRERGVLPADVDTGKLALAILAALEGGLLLTKVSRDVGALEASLDTMIAHVEHLAARAG